MNPARPKNELNRVTNPTHTHTNPNHYHQRQIQIQVQPIQPQQQQQQRLVSSKLPQRRTPLDRSAPSSIETLLDTSHERTRPTVIFGEIIRLSWPISLTTMFESLPLIVMTALVGHSDPATALPRIDTINSTIGTSTADVLQAYGLANLVESTCAFAIVFGLMSGLDSVAASSVGFTNHAKKAQTSDPLISSSSSSTFKPQSLRSYQSLSSEGEILPSTPLSYGSLPSSSLLGTWVTRCIQLELIFVTICIVLLYFFCESGLRWLGEPEESIPIAVEYVNVLLVSLPFVAVYLTLNKGLQASSIVFPVLMIVFIVKLVALSLVYYELFHWQMSIIAIAWTLTFSYMVQLLAVYLYMRFTGIIDLWWGSDDDVDDGNDESSESGWCCSSFWRGLWAYAILALPAALAVCLEFWLFDLFGMMSGLLPNSAIELSTHYLMFTTCFLNYMVFSGLSVGVSVVVGQRMGVSGESRVAHRSAVIGTLLCMGVSCILGIVLLIAPDLVAHALTSDPMVLQRFYECLPILIAYQLVDGLNTCSTQLLRTLGVQHVGVLLHFCTYYLIGVSCGYLLGFEYGWGVYGLWCGLCIGVGLNATIATCYLWFITDWDEQCKAAIQRAVESSDEIATQS